MSLLKTFSVYTMKVYNQRGRGTFFAGERHQRGRGTFFAGARYQRGHGFFSSMVHRAVLPFLKYLGTQGIKTAVAIGEEAISNPSEFKNIAKRKLQEVGIQAVDDGAKRIKKFVQTGEGVESQQRDKLKILKPTKNRKLIIKSKTWLM